MKITSKRGTVTLSMSPVDAQALRKLLAEGAALTVDHTNFRDLTEYEAALDILSCDGAIRHAIKAAGRM